MKNEKKPNVVLILIDDMGWKDLGVCGSTFYESPNIDALMNDGTRFSNAFAACPVCSPSRASIMSGKYPATVGVTDWIDHLGEMHPLKGKLIDSPYIKHLPLSEKTIATQLKENGYATWHIGKWHLGDKPYYPTEQGFDINKGGCFWGHPFNGYFSPYGIPTLEDGPEGEYLTDRLTDEAIELIKDSKDEPFFLNMWYYSVHMPCQAPQNLVDRFTKKAERLGLDKMDPMVVGKYKPIQNEKKERIIRRMIQSDPVYAAMVYSLDLNIGRIVNTLKETGKLENTIIVFTSDNGGLSTSESSPTCNLPAAEGKGWMYDGGIRVPLSFTWKDHIQKNQTVDLHTTSPDLYPTILDLVNIKNHNEIDGKSIYEPIINSRTPKELIDRDLFWHYPHYGNQGGTPTSSIRNGDWKLIEFFEDMHIELYNTKEDISESFDLVKQYPERANSMKQRLHAWRESIDAKIPLANPDWKE